MMAASYVNMDSLQDTNLLEVCRLCLSHSISMIPLFPYEEVDVLAVSLSMKVTICTSISISKIDGLPKSICLDCFSFLRQWYAFRQKCQLSDSTLKKKTYNVPYQCDSFANSVQKFSSKINISDTDSRDATMLQDINDENSVDKVILNLDEQTIKKREVLSETCTERFKCRTCPDSFLFLQDLKSHESMVHNEKMKLKNRKKKVELQFTPKRRLKSSYEVKCCGKVFTSKGLFRHHLWKKHPGEKPFSCDVCGKKDFISEETLKRHKMLHTGRYACEICGRRFTCHAILRIHERDKHENDRPFVCDVCGKAFVTELLLSYHQRFHTGEKKYVCEECGVAVVTSSSLAKHKRTHSKVKPHICAMCGKGFIVRGRLIEHIRVHTGERPFVCKVCNKAFTMQDKLKRHMRSHTDHKAFSCEICGNAYTTNHGLTVHRKIHTLSN